MMDMPQGMPAQAAPTAQPQPKEPEAGGARELVSGIHSGMVQFMDLLDKTPQIAPEEKQRLGSLIQGFQELVESLGQPPGPPAQKPQAAPTGAAPMEAGMSNAKPAL
jgi:hypothetical protein